MINTSELPNFSKLAEKLGIQFADLKLLRQALTHRSYLNENRGVDWQHNERLEFLGDAVLELVSTDYLYHRYPDKTEGNLTAYRAALVNTDIIAQAAEDLGINDYLLLSRGEAKDTESRARRAILANTFESIIGAIYLDQQFAGAEKFIKKYLDGQVEMVVGGGLWQDAKSLFQEKAQAKLDITPSYSVIKEVGPDHDKLFTVGLYLGTELEATGEGHSKQEAEQAAARVGLAGRQWD